VLEPAFVPARAAADGEVEAPIFPLFEVLFRAATTGSVLRIVRELALVSSRAPAHLEVEAATARVPGPHMVTSTATVIIVTVTVTGAPVTVTVTWAPVIVRTALVSSRTVTIVVAPFIVVLSWVQEAAVVAARAATNVGFSLKCTCNALAFFMILIPGIFQCLFLFKRVVVAGLWVSEAAITAASALAHREVVTNRAIVVRCRTVRDPVRSVFAKVTAATLAARRLRDVRLVVTVPVPVSVALLLRDVEEAALIAACAAAN